MRTLLYSCILALFILTGCASSKNYLERSNADKALLDAVKKINKTTTDEKAIEAIPLLYNTIKTNHLARISDLKNDKDPARWDKIIKEYESLQEAYDAIVTSDPAFRLVTPQSFSSELFDARQSAAEEYYNYGLQSLEKKTRDDAKKAYSYFKKSDKYVPGYRDAKLKIQEAIDAATVNVVINPVQDNSFFFNSSWGNAGYNYSNEYFQQTLARELSGTNNRYPARFYTDWQARRDNIQPDWAVDLKLRNIDIPFYPSQSKYQRTSSAQVQIGTDTSGNPVYKTVYATLYITRGSFTARANMDVSITDVKTGKSISYRTFSDDYRWQQESATYSGDSRALSSRDWELINNAGYSNPRKEDILNELYRKIYPQVKNNITYAVDW